MSSSHSLDMEKKAEVQNASSAEHQAVSSTRRTRRSLLPWYACLALVLLVVAGGRTAVCGRSSQPELAVSNAVVHNDGPARLEVGNHLGVEPPAVVKRQTPATSSAAASPTVLECFQVAPPVLTPQGLTDSDGSKVLSSAGASEESCTVLLMEHSFAYSYGLPFIGKLHHITSRPQEL